MPFVYDPEKDIDVWEDDRTSTAAGREAFNAMPVYAPPVAIEESKESSPAPAPTATATPTAPKKVEEKAPWWASVGNEVKANFRLERPSIDLQAELKNFSDPNTAMARGAHLATSSLLNSAGVNSPFMRDFVQKGAARATSNIAKNISDAAAPLRGGQSGDMTQIQEEAGVDEILDTYYRTNGYTPPSEMTPDELAADEMGATIVLNGALAVLTMGAGAAFQGTALATRFPWLARAVGQLDPTKAKTFAGALTRIGLGQVVDEVPSTFLDDNTQGSAVQLPAAIVGMVNPEAGQAIAQMDPVKPGMGRTEASLNAFGPNLVAAISMAGVLGGGATGLSRLASNLPGRQRAMKAQTTRTRAESARGALEEAGITQTDETGKTAFTEEVSEVSVKDGETMAQWEARWREENGIDPDPVVEGEDAGAVLDGELPATQSPEIVDPWAIEYDPETIEVDQFKQALEDNGNDAQLDEIFIRSDKENIVAVAEEVLQRGQGQPVNPDMRMDMVGAHVGSLAMEGVGNAANRFSSVSDADLISLANPKNSPELAAEILEATGKDFSQINRSDVLVGLGRLALNGNPMRAMPSRMMGQPMMRTGEIQVDPQRFQFKQGVDAEGQQKGNSLTGVGTWNEDLEGVIQVWEDPADGLTYVINGHNRLAKAKQLNIPSMRVEYINASSAEVARGKGALTNIAQGGGTAFDAAKYFRESGLDDPSHLEALGVPLKSGLGTEGLALSKLPDNIFQDAVDGRLSRAKAMALGGSGLDESGMQAAYKALQARDMSEGTFNEVLQQAKNAPTVQGDQVDLFGNTDMLNLMVQKGELAARIRKDLMADKNLMKRTASNAKRLTEVGNEIDKAGTATLADDTAALLAEFDATKYVEGPTSQLLNEGAEQVANGAKIKVVADRIRRQLIEAGKGTPLPVKAAEEVVEKAPTPPISRKEKVTQLVKKAARKGEARPQSSPLPDSPDPGKLDLEGTREDVGFLEVLDNEARLNEEFASRDDMVKGWEEEARRDAIRYDDMTFDEKKSHGMLDGLEPVSMEEALAISKARELAARGDVIDPEVLPPEQSGGSITAGLRKAIDDMKESDRRMARRTGQLIDSMEDGLGKLKTSLDEPPALEASSQFTFPKGYEKSNPRFGQAELVFESDLDRAAYILQSPSKSDKALKTKKALRTALEQQGYDVDEVRRLGADVKKQIQDGIEEATGSRRAPQSSLKVEVPRSGMEGGSQINRSQNQSFNGLPPDDQYSEAAVRKKWERIAADQKLREATALMDVGMGIGDDIKTRVLQSELFALELKDGLRDALRISGADPERIKVIDQIDMQKMFGDDSIESLAQWDPQAARFVKENPQDPLVSSIDPRNTPGVQIRKGYEGIHGDMIYLALGPNLDLRLGSRMPGGGRAMQRTPYHEAFHKVQEWLHDMALKGVGDTESLYAALHTPEALKEMRRVIDKDPLATKTPNMAAAEIQAEAFSSWFHNRNIKMRAGGVQKAFEKMKMFINTLRRKWGNLLKKDPRWVDVFELAAEGKIAKKGLKTIEKLTPEQLAGLQGRISPSLDALLPELTDRVMAYMKQKQADFEVLLTKLDDESFLEGC